MHARPQATSRLLAMLACIALTACATEAGRPDAQAAMTDARTEGAARTTPVARPAGSGDGAWLDRLTFGISPQSEAQLRALGRRAWLDAQLGATGDALPPQIARQIDALEVSHLDPVVQLATLASENKRIATLPDGPEREAARKALNEHGNALAYQAQRRELLRAIYSGAQLREQMVAFWLNHFSVFQYKANLRWLVGDYAEHAIRPHALGSFRALVLATLEHPAMLQYLDNAQNAAGRLNENYARELMELHTLGVGGGYTQQDVQALARILSGAGVYAGGDAPKLKPEWQPLYRRVGAFEFNPARHDFGDKIFLGQTVHGSGFAEIEQAVTRLTDSEACAHFISRQMAMWFIADDPPAALVERMAQRFHATQGDIAAVLRTMIDSPEFTRTLGQKFKDPLHYVVSAMRLAYDTRAVTNLHPVLGWLNSLGEAPFNRLTPDGYPLNESGWASSGQMSRRFEIARAIGGGSAGLFDPEDGGAPVNAGFPRLSNELTFRVLEPALSATTRQALDAATSQQEWNTLLLAAPEFNYH